MYLVQLKVVLQEPRPTARAASSVAHKPGPQESHPADERLVA